MVQMSGKTFIAIFAISLTITAVLIIGYFLKWFAPLEGLGGALAAGLYEIFATPLRWILSGGWVTMLAGIFGGVAVIVIFAYIGEVKQPIATLKGTNNTASGNYQGAPSQNMIPLDSNMQSTPTEKKE